MMKDHEQGYNKTFKGLRKAELVKLLESLNADIAETANSKVKVKPAPLDQKTPNTKTDQVLRQQARLLDLSYDAIFVWELKGGIQYWNRAAAELYGWTKEEALGRSSNDLLKTTHPLGLEIIEEALLSDGHWYGELTHQARDGRRIVVDSRHVLVREEDGRLLVLETNRDLTSRKRAEKALRQSEVRLRNTMDSLMEGCQIIGFNWEYLYVNEVAARQGHRAPEEFVGRKMMELYPGIEDTAVFGILRRCMDERIACRKENEFIFPDGSRGQFELRVQPVPEGIFIISSDITERVRTEQELRASREQLANVINAAMDAIISIDNQQRIVIFNHAAERIFGYTAEEALGQPLSILIPEQFRTSHEQYINLFSETGETGRAMGSMGAASGLRHNGEVFPIEASISQIETSGQKLFTVTLRDVTERVRANERLIEQAALLNQSHEAIIVRDLDGRIRYWSHGAENLYGWKAEEVIDRTAMELIYRQDTRLLLEATRTTLEKGEWNGELRHFTKDGREVIVDGHWTLVRDFDGRPKNILAINTDITEKKKIESHLFRSQRLESIGTLAGGIAHDLNNILSPILMGTQMLQMKLQDEQDKRLLGVMQLSANRGAEMLKQVLSFARGMGGERVVLQSKHLIREIIRIAEETFPKSIQIESNLDDELWAITGDATQLHQVLLNLFVNARDAMPGGGLLIITAQNCRLDRLYAHMLKGVAPGNFVNITITDTGVGISPEIADHIFDPFFTTKEPGQGTGLGLATVQGIITSHGGFVTLESNPGQGSKFSIYLPAHEDVVEQEASEDILQIPSGAGQLILVVDDEATVREMTRTALEAFGYRTLTAENGATALAVYADHKNEVNAVLTDLMMPVMDGLSAIRALRRLDPRLCIVATSGLTDSTKAAELEELRVKHLLAKPYNAEILLKTIAGALSNH